MVRGTSTPAFLFDLDGTLIDSVYQHVTAWRAALSDGGIDLPVWRIHRRIGMSGGLFVAALARETGIALDPERADWLQQRHAAHYTAAISTVAVLASVSRISMSGAWAARNARTESMVMRLCYGFRRRGAATRQTGSAVRRRL